MKVLEQQRKYTYPINDRLPSSPAVLAWPNRVAGRPLGRKELERRIPIGDQLNTSRCTGFASSFMLGHRSYQLNLDLEPSANGLYALGRYAALAPNEPLDDSGASFHQVFVQSMKFGIPDERDCPSDATRVLDDIPFEGLIQAQGQLLTPSEWVTLDDQTGDERLRAIDRLLDNDFPVGGGRHVVRGFGQLRSSEMQGAAYVDYNDDVLGYHAMVIVGYDLERDSYTIRNSYGKDWGSSEAGPGHLYVKRSWVHSMFDLTAITLLGSRHAPSQAVPPRPPARAFRPLLGAGRRLPLRPHRGPVHGG